MFPTTIFSGIDIRIFTLMKFFIYSDIIQFDILRKQKFRKYIDFMTLPMHK